VIPSLARASTRTRCRERCGAVRAQELSWWHVPAFLGHRLGMDAEVAGARRVAMPARNWRRRSVRFGKMGMDTNSRSPGSRPTPTIHMVARSIRYASAQSTARSEQAGGQQSAPSRRRGQPNPFATAPPRPARRQRGERGRCSAVARLSRTARSTAADRAHDRTGPLEPHDAGHSAAARRRFTVLHPVGSPSFRCGAEVQGRKLSAKRVAA